MRGDDEPKNIIGILVVFSIAAWAGIGALVWGFYTIIKSMQ